MSNKKRHLHNLFTHLVNSKSHEAVLEMARLLEDERREGEIDWHAKVGKRDLAAGCLLQAQQAMENAQARDKTELREHQRRMARIMMAAGLDLSEDGNLMDEALRRGLVDFVAQVVKTRQLTHTPHIEGILGRISITKTLAFIRAWQDDPAMEGICQRTLEHLRNRAWLARNVSQKSMMEIRRGHSWTREQAEMYMRTRLYPDWQNRQYSDRALDIPLDPLLSEDRVPLIEKIPAQAWEETLFAGPYRDKDAQILSCLSGRMGKRVERLSIPLPEYEWMEQYVEHRMRDIFELQASKDWVARDWAVEFSLANRYIQEMESGQWSWEGVGAALGCMMISTVLATQEKGTPPEDMVEMRGRIEQGIRKHLAEQVPKLDGKGFFTHCMIADKWIKLGEQKTIEKHGLPKWPEVDGNDHLRKKSLEYFHYSMVLAYKDRLENLEHDGPSIPQMAVEFWVHLMNSSGNGINKVLEKIMNQGQQSRAEDRVWKIQRADPRLTELLQSRQGQDFLKSRGQKAKLMRKNAFLKLSALLGRGYEDESKAQQQRPRI